MKAPVILLGESFKMPTAINKEIKET